MTCKTIKTNKTIIQMTSLEKVEVWFINEDTGWAYSIAIHQETSVKIFTGYFPAVRPIAAVDLKWHQSTYSYYRNDAVDQWKNNKINTRRRFALMI